MEDRVRAVRDPGIPAELAEGAGRQFVLKAMIGILLAETRSPAAPN